VSDDVARNICQALTGGVILRSRCSTISWVGLRKLKPVLKAPVSALKAQLRQTALKLCFQFLLAPLQLGYRSVASARLAVGHCRQGLAEHAQNITGWFQEDILSNSFRTLTSGTTRFCLTHRRCPTCFVKRCARLRMTWPAGPCSNRSLFSLIVRASTVEG